MRSCHDIFGEQTIVTPSQEDFLSNKNNTDHLMAKLKLCLVEAGSTSSSSPASHPEEVANTGEMFVRALYPGGDKCNNIDDLRLHLYNRTVARQDLTASFELSVLPPTKGELYQHSLRTYLQADPAVYIRERRGNELPPTDWGWHFST
ncbi:hypothetical protein PR048_020014 [Dryococelus australis]|uniref:Uncharacterized protein n=1 Tax=Dryococelus australis TaxID=614101 RepID=A0ABQ9H535_9NEOP|nr:hypothetical protein PR048_020014 [Dryococelus australis]